MLVVHIWDEITNSWNPELVKTLDAKCRDPHIINREVNKSTGESDGDPEGPRWQVANYGWCGDILTIEVRSAQGDLSVLMVEYNLQKVPDVVDELADGSDDWKYGQADEV